MVSNNRASRSIIYAEEEGDDEMSRDELTDQVLEIEARA